MLKNAFCALLKTSDQEVKNLFSSTAEASSGLIAVTSLDARDYKRLGINPLLPSRPFSLVWFFKPRRCRDGITRGAELLESGFIVYRTKTVMERYLRHRRTKLTFGES